MCRRGHRSSAASVPVCHFAYREDVPRSRLTSESHLYTVDLSKLCEQRDDKEDDVEEEEKDPVGPTQVEAAQWNDDERQDQRQTQSSCENPRQQTLQFKLHIGVCLKHLYQAS